MHFQFMKIFIKNKLKILQNNEYFNNNEPDIYQAIRNDFIAFYFKSIKNDRQEQMRNNTLTFALCTNMLKDKP